MVHFYKNNIMIKAPDDEIERLLGAGIEKNVLNTIFPMPEHIFNGNFGPEECIQHTGYPNKEKWTSANWGVKCDIIVQEFEVSNGFVIIKCETAFRPPLEAFVNYTRVKPDVTVFFDFSEPTILLYHATVIINGKISE